MDSKESIELKKVGVFNSLGIFLEFMKGDSRISDAFRWSFSIETKIMAIGILNTEVISQIPKCIEDMQSFEKTKASSYLPYLILSIKYEVFLNSIYAICENLSNVVYQLYRGKVPLGFRDQKKRFLLDKSIDSPYSLILENTDWYDEVNSMRSEAIHFLSGIITFSSPTELGYINIPKNNRKGAQHNIRIQDVEKHTRGIYFSVRTFVSEFAKHFLTVLEQDNSIIHTCHIIPNSGAGYKKISLNEFLKNEAGICQTPEFQCPEKDSCRARKPNI
jgi:hypothetical protein